MIMSAAMKAKVVGECCGGGKTRQKPQKLPQATRMNQPVRRPKPTARPSQADILTAASVIKLPPTPQISVPKPRPTK